jgi:hypothetical protein
VSKAKGTRNEHRSIALLEASGYRCTRSAGSLGGLGHRSRRFDGYRACAVQDEPLAVAGGNGSHEAFFRAG